MTILNEKKIKKSLTLPMNIVWPATWCLLNTLSCLIGLMALYIFCDVNIINSSWLWFVLQVLVHFLWAVFIRLWYSIKRFDCFCYQRHRNIWQSWLTQSASYFFNCMVVEVVMAYIYTTCKMLLPYVLFEFCFKLSGLWLTDMAILVLFENNELLNLVFLTISFA